MDITICKFEAFKCKRFAIYFLRLTLDSREPSHLFRILKQFDLKIQINWTECGFFNIRISFFCIKNKSH